MNFIKNLFYVPKHGYISDKTFIANIIACVIGVVICLTSLTYATWAWFSQTVNTSTINMQAANYEISVTATDSDGNAVTVTADGQNKYITNLSINHKYTVTVKAVGTAKTGYCKISANGKEYFTAPVLKGQTVTFKIDCYEETEVLFIASWGSYSGGNIINDTLVLGTPSEKAKDENISPEPEIVPEQEKTTETEEEPETTVNDTEDNPSVGDTV